MERFDNQKLEKVGCQKHYKLKANKLGEMCQRAMPFMYKDFLQINKNSLTP